jgi:hypothetical protein
MEQKPQGKIKRVPKKGGGFNYEIEGDTSTKNREYYEEKIEEAKDEDGYPGELDNSLRTWTKRVNEAPEGDKELPRMEARLESLKALSEKYKKHKK